MPIKVFAFDQIKKFLGWCPACRKMTLQTEQSCNFVDTAQVSGKTGNLPEFRTSNVIFPANTTLVVLLFAIGINVLLRYPKDIYLFLAGLLLLNISSYLLILKTFEAAVQVNRSEIRLQAFRLKKFEIPYEEIESVTSHKLEKRSKKMSLLLVIGGIALCGFIIYYMAAVEGEWNIFLLFISLIPLLLFAERKQKTRFGDLNTQLYIKTRHKRWFEWTPYYSLITDEASAAELKSIIEKHL